MEKNNMDLRIECLDVIEAPLMSNDFWTGVGIGVAIVGAVAAIAVIT